MLMTVMVNLILWTVTMSLPAFAMLLFYSACLRVARQEQQKEQDLEQVKANLESLAGAPHLVEWKFKRYRWALQEANWLLVRKRKQ
jgi:hypothetical protein